MRWNELLTDYLRQRIERKIPNNSHGKQPREYSVCGHMKTT